MEWSFIIVKTRSKVFNPKAHCVKTILKMSISKAFKNICPKGCTKIAHKSSKKLPKKSTKELQKNRPKNPKTIPKKSLPKNLPKKSSQKSPNITKSTSSTRSMRYYKNSLTSLLAMLLKLCLEIIFYFDSWSEKIMYYHVVNYKSNHTYIHISREGTFRLVSKLCNSAIDHIFSAIIDL